MSKIKLIIFDANGVCFNGGYPQTCQWLAKKYHRNWQDLYKIIYKKYFNLAALKKISQQQAWSEAIKETNLPTTVTGIKKIHYGLMSINKSTMNLIEKLKEDYQVVLLSKNTRSQLGDMNKFFPELLQVFGKNIINTWEYNLPKASTETMNFIFNKFKVKSREVVYIDDQDENLLPARALEVNTILFKNFTQANRELKSILK